MNVAALEIVAFAMLLLLVATALIIVTRKTLLSVVILTGIYSFLGAGWMLLLDAPDVAFTEAAVGAGISTVLFLATMALTRHVSAAPRRLDWLPVVAVVLTGAALLYGTSDMPRFGDPAAPAQAEGSLSHFFLESERAAFEAHHGDHHDDEHHGEDEHHAASPAGKDAVGLPNAVTTILASYRGYDTFGETTVVFAAGIGVILLLSGLSGTQFTGRVESNALKRMPVLRIVTKLVIPYILLFGLYVQFHGDFGPGGGFQAGVIVAAALILYGLVFGLGPTMRVVSPLWVERLVAGGVLLYAGVGIASMLRGGNFLDHAVLASSASDGEHYGILLVELGVGVTVTAVMLAIFYSFAGRGRPA